MAFANYCGANIERFIGNCLRWDQLFTVDNGGRYIKYGKAIFHAETLPVEVGHHMLDPRVILKTVSGEIFSVARVLKTTMWHL